MVAAGEATRSMRSSGKTIRRRTVPPHENLPASLGRVLQRIYAARGIRSAGELDYSLNHLPSYETLLGLERATGLLYEAMLHRRRILVVADFDADGATSCAVLMRGLSAMGASDVRFLVPNRFEFGYGLTPELVEVAARFRPYVIVTVDNGIASVEGVSRAKELGMKVLVTDHHLPGDQLPEPEAIVNPNQLGDEFPGKNLAGVGVVFYLLMALRARLRDTGWFSTQARAEPKLAALLDLVALGTVADMVPLDYTNRILVAQGMARIRAARCSAGMAALLEVSGRRMDTLTSSDLSFAVAPRLNAAGRLTDMSLGIECLLTDRPDEALAKAWRLDELNRERRAIQTEMETDARTIVDCLMGNGEVADSAVCLYDQSWHQGVVGILASRMMRRLERPVIVFARGEDGMLKGSARSVEGVHIKDVLDGVSKRHPAMIHRFGGHAMAAGLTLEASHLEAFKQAFAHMVDDWLGGVALQRNVLYTDGELQPEEMTLTNAELLRREGPWGQGFPEPVFDGCFCVRSHRVVGGDHLKMGVSHSERGPIMDAIAFNHGTTSTFGANQQVSAAYRLDVNAYHDARKLQLVVENLEPIP